MYLLSKRYILHDIVWYVEKTVVACCGAIHSDNIFYLIAATSEGNKIAFFKNIPINSEHVCDIDRQLKIKKTSKRKNITIFLFKNVVCVEIYKKKKKI